MLIEDISTRSWAQRIGNSPVVPDVMEERLRNAEFTNGKEDRQLVIQLYQSHFQEHFGLLEKASYSNRGWREEDVIRFSKVVEASYTPNLKEIDLSNNSFGKDGWEALGRALPALENLTKITLGNTQHKAEHRSTTNAWIFWLMRWFKSGVWR